LSLVAAACGSDSDADSSSDSTPAGTDAETGNAVAGGTAADTSLDPVKIGLIVQDEELVAFPEARSAAEAMIGYFNAELGGADGHPIELTTCAAGDTPESAVACAQELVNDDDVHVVIAATLNTPSVAETLTAASRPMISLGNDIPDFLTPGQYTFDPGLLGQAQGVLQYAAEGQQAETATLFLADDPTFDAFEPVLLALAEGVGIDIDQVIRLGFEADVSGPVSAASTDSDAWLFVLADGAQCSAASSAAKTVGYDGVIVASDLCVAEDLVTSGEVDGWYAPLTSSAPVKGGQDADEIERILTTYGSGDAQRAGFTGYTIGAMQVALESLVAAGGTAATDESVATVLDTFASEHLLGFPPVSCPGPGAWVSACHRSPLIVLVADGAMVSPDGFLEIDYSIFDALLEG
jgi:branched-chain amino acid transport system substrate-binding protein